MTEMHRCSIDVLYHRAIKDNIPLSANFELTYRCNLRCSHCYVVDRGERELSFSEITDILDQLAAVNCLFLTLTGGEPLMREDLLDIARYSHKKGFDLKLFSNGTLIDGSMAGKLASLKPLRVGISIYGADDATHDQLTGVPGSFNRSLRALRLLKEAGVFTMVKCLVMKENVAQLEEIGKLAHEIGAVFQFDPIVTPRNDGNREPLQHELDEADLYRLLSYVVDDPGPINKKVRLSPESIICGAGRDSCCISPGGELYPCVALPVPLGNLRHQSFVDIWQGAEAAKLRRFRFADLYQCCSCPELDYCTRCWGLAAVESGDHLGPANLNCRIARIRHRISVEHSKSKAGGAR
jgi:radical SAM protein with 4Fe4S-binding SPASM domain